MPHYRRTIRPVISEGDDLLVKDENGAFVRLQGTGRRIWDRLEYPVRLERLVGGLAAEYDGDPNEIAPDVSAFVAALGRRGIVESVGAPAPVDARRFRYFSLLKRALVNLLYPEHEMRIDHLQRPAASADATERTRYLRDIRYREPERYGRLDASKHAAGLSGEIAHAFPHTMIGLAALDSLERCAEQVFREQVPGDFFEAGVCQGGASIFLRALQVASGEGQRRTWLADSFQGLPLRDPLSSTDRGIKRFDRRSLA